MSESLDWAQVLSILQVSELTLKTVVDTAGTIAKHQADVTRSMSWRPRSSRSRMIDRIVSRFVAKLRERGCEAPARASTRCARWAPPASSTGPRRGRSSSSRSKNAKELALFAEAFDEFFGGLTDADPSRNPGDVVDEAILSLEEKTRSADPASKTASGPAPARRRRRATRRDGPGPRSPRGAGRRSGGGGRGRSHETRRYRGEKAKAEPGAQLHAGSHHVKEELLERWRNHGVKPFLPEEEAAMGRWSPAWCGG